MESNIVEFVEAANIPFAVFKRITYPFSAQSNAKSQSYFLLLLTILLVLQL